MLLATVGSLGDLHPYIAVARALAARGAEPVIATVPEARADVEREGIRFAPVRPGFAHFGDYQALLEKLFDVRRGVEFLIREMVMPHLRTAHADLSRAADGADLLVSHPLTMTLPLIAEQRRLPWVSTILSPLSLMSSFDPPLIAHAEWLLPLRRLGRLPYRTVFNALKLLARHWEAPLRALRRELGLPPARGMAMLEGQFSPYLNLALFDPPLAKPQPDWPARLQVCGAPLYDGHGQTFLPEGEPPLVFALGSSAVWVAGDFWERAIDAAVRLKRRAILVVGPAKLPVLPSDIKAFEYLPYSALFPHAAAIVHQGGIGTLSQAMRSGRPQLIVPFAFDQPDNARRAAALGVARVLRLKELDAMPVELERLLGDPRYEASARRLAGELAQVDGAGAAADALISLAGNR